MPHATTASDPGRLRGTVLLVAGLNVVGFGVEVVVALAIGSVALVADSVDVLEDASVNVLTPLVLTALFAALVNAVCAPLLVRVRHHAGSMGRAAWLSARNDVPVDLAVVAMAGVTAWTASGWPDIVVGVAVVLLNGTAAWEVWRLAGEERLAARALAGEDVD